MKSSNIEVNEFFTNDYIYIPYTNKDELNIRSNSLVFKNDLICENISSPVSGKIYGLSKINGVEGTINVLIIENDFKDLVYELKPAVKDIYKLKKEDVKKNANITDKNIVLCIQKNYKNDIKDSYILKDYVKEVLETLNIINLKCNIKTKILLEKKDIFSYQVLFSYLGTYPNIQIEFNHSKVKNYKEINIYDALDIYNKLNNNINRDFLYLTIQYKQKCYVIKTKRFSNLSEILLYLNISPKKVYINNVVISDINYLLTENVSLISII